MRRTSAIAGACAVLAPLLLVGASGASAAAGTSLTVHTIGRSGHQVDAQVQAYNVGTRREYPLDAGKATSLPRGTYDVIADISDAGSYQDETFAGRSVSVSGATGVTLDARKGRAVSVGLSPRPATGVSYDHRVVADVCADDGLVSLTGSAEAGHVFVVPSSVKALSLAYGTEYDPESSSGGNYYLATGLHTGGLPNGLSATPHQSALTALKVSARSGPDSGSADFDLRDDIRTNDCVGNLDRMNFERDLPNYFTAHVPAGPWYVSVAGHGMSAGNLPTSAAGRTTQLTFGHAVWGPGTLSTPIVIGRHLDFYTGDMFADPTLGDTGPEGRVALKVTKSGKTLYSRTYATNQMPTVNSALSAGWYTISQVAKRTPGRSLPAGSLSSTSSLVMHSYINPASDAEVRGYVSRFWPDALNTRNQAAPRSTTAVVVTPSRDTGGIAEAVPLSNAAKSVHVWASTDGGKTWHAASLKHSGAKWTASVHNPASGRVALRSTVTDIHGDTSTTTVYNAYAIA